MQTGPAREVGETWALTQALCPLPGSRGGQRGSSSTRAVRQGPGGSLAPLVSQSPLQWEAWHRGGTGSWHLPGCPSLAPCAVPLNLREGHGDGSLGTWPCPSEESPGLPLGQVHLGSPRGSVWPRGGPRLLLSLAVGPNSQTSSPETGQAGPTGPRHHGPGTWCPSFACCITVATGGGGWAQVCWKA